MNKNNTNKPNRFIILSRYRSGTNLLKSGIEQHPEVMVRPELFNNVFISSNPERYINENILNDIFYTNDDRIKSIGLKIMYEQATEAELDEDYFAPDKGVKIKQINNWLQSKGLSKNAFSHIWKSFQKDTSIKVLHVVRSNQLHSFVSFQLAIIEGKWIGDKYESAGEGGLYINKNKLEQWFRNGDEHYHYFNDYFKSHEILEVYYKDMVNDFPVSITRVFDFLGHDSVSQISPGINKQNIYQMPEIINNYEELKSYFAASKWAIFFND